MMRTFVCNKFKSYSIRNHYFVNGKFQTDDADVIKLIENADGYGVFIHPAETAEELEALREIEPVVLSVPEDFVEQEEPPPIAVRGARGTGNNKYQRKGDIRTK
jgi:hypothetical protein